MTGTGKRLPFTVIDEAWLVGPDMWSVALDEAIDSVVSRISARGAQPAEPAGRLRGQSHPAAAPA